MKKKVLFCLECIIKSVSLHRQTVKMSVGPVAQLDRATAF